ncbi:MAG: rhodanese-like domain-containing protein [Clostridia bacterium]|nr:rhodanese-like domain-containing protein [Deltaproteobacteria bacterium]
MAHTLIAEAVPGPGGILEVTPQQVNAGAKGMRLIDVREVNEFSAELGHIAGAELVPLGTIEHAAKDWDKKQPLVMVCRSGGRSGKATQALRAMGFEEVVNMRGGMLAYNQAELPVEGRNSGR